ncbi:MAG TPA: hypothetical protein VFV00_09875 [Acidimicrobiales bacterium]|nr:hypothetical protein [Acidimicrobiales bacterium]
MSVLWVLPLLCLTVGAVLVTLAMRETTATTVALRDECARLGELRAALVDLRTEGDIGRAHLDDLRHRSSRAGLDR